MKKILKDNFTIFLMLLITIIVLIISTISQNSSDITNTQPQFEEAVETNSKDENANDNNHEQEEEKQENEEKPEKTPKQLYEELKSGEKYSQVNGSVVPEEVLLQRPIAIMFDNHPYARPQSSLAYADIVYEILVEGNFTRYMGIFQSTLPKHIGAIRSARPYFLRFALEYDAYYTHVGGSEQAKSDIKNFKMADIDAMASGRDTFWREKHRKAPHNMYASVESLLEWAKYMGYREKYNIDELKFAYDSNTNDNSIIASTLNIEYKPSSNRDKTGYYAKFVYNKEKDLYYRYVNSKPHIDEVTKEQLATRSIIIQRASTRTIDNEGRLAIDLVGEGSGYYAHSGKLYEISWKKDSERSRTKYYKNDGEELILNAGKIWIQVVPKSVKLNKVLEHGSESFEAIFSK